METKKYVPKKELTAFCVAGMGQGMIYALMSSYISDYYLNVLQLTPMFVLLLMLLARVWDAINDPLMGMIVDRSNLKSGKMIPFIRFALIPVAVVTILGLSRRVATSLSSVARFAPQLRHLSASIISFSMWSFLTSFLPWWRSLPPSR